MSKGSILLVEEDRPILDMLENYLGVEKGFETATASSGSEAQRLVSEREFDAALIDLVLPDSSGLELIKSLQELRPAMLCVVMTGDASLESSIEALRLNAFDYLQKPFDLSRVGEIMEAACGESEMLREHRDEVEDLERMKKKLERSRDDLSRKVEEADRELAVVNESLRRHVTRLKMLFQMGRDISSNENWSDALDRFLMALCQFIEADGSALLLYSEEGRVLKVRTSYNMEEKFLETSVNLLLEAQGRDILENEIFKLDTCTGSSIDSCLSSRKAWGHSAIPLIYRNRWLGFLIVRKRYRTRKSYLDDYHFLTTIQTILTEEVANAVNISRLRNLKDFNETILDNINSGVLKVDREGRIVFTNKRAREMIGGADSEGSSFDSLFSNPFGSGGLFHHLACGERKNFTLEGNLSRKGGERAPVRISTTLVETDEYEGRSLVVVFDDLTEQKAMEEELRRADRLRSLGELSAGVAHEIRNPLTGIATTAQVLKELLEGEEGKLRYISVILEEIRRLDRIIRNLLDFARPSTPRPDEVSIEKLAEEVLELLSKEASLSGVELKLVSELDDDTCMVDRDQIKQVMLNITKNGIEACDRGGKVTLYLRPSADRSRIRIDFEDNGCGISEEAGDRLYNPFFTTRSEGNGLGLSISRKILEAHGGKIAHDSDRDAGTCFHVEIPRKTVTAAASAEAQRVS